MSKSYNTRENIKVSPENSKRITAKQKQFPLIKPSRQKIGNLAIELGVKLINFK